MYEDNKLNITCIHVLDITSSSFLRLLCTIIASKISNIAKHTLPMVAMAIITVLRLECKGLSMSKTVTCGVGMEGWFEKLLHIEEKERHKFPDVLKERKNFKKIHFNSSNNSMNCHT